ncbi:spermatogenesis-associated protein 31D1-like [Pipistrellus kuhlii]|uniref:spermatogenesis-associated protein 31D1-like n=1 Tax=Pipistrellus kuhlii TaxID=59472 RepID=UPI00174F3241|nr:spermatogenesis-associated protein 31D1-like [Pipistrellus kuhlii]
MGTEGDFAWGDGCRMQCAGVVQLRCDRKKENSSVVRFTSETKETIENKHEQKGYVLLQYLPFHLPIAFEKPHGTEILWTQDSESSGSLNMSTTSGQSQEEKERRDTGTSLGRNHDSNHFRQLLCPDPSCDICNNATAEVNQLFSKALESSTPSVSPVVSTAPMTALERSTPSVSPVVSTAPVTALVAEPSFHQSSAFPGVPKGELRPPSLIEPSLPSPSPLPTNSITALGNFLSPSPSYQTLTTEPSSHSDSELLGQHSSSQTKHFSSSLTQYDFHQKLSDIHSTKISSVEDTAVKLTDPTQLFFLSSEEHDSVEHDSYPKTWEDNLKQEVIQLFWGLPSLHSESLLSAVHASGYYSIFNSISNAFISQGSSGLPYFLPPSLPKVQPQLLPQTLPLYHHSPLTQLQPQVHLQSPLPILQAGLIDQTKVCGAYCHTPLNESESLTSSDIEELELNVLKKKQEGLWGLPSLALSSWEACFPSAPTSPYYGPSKAHISISIDHFEYPLSAEFRKKFEHHLRKRLIQHRWGLPLRIHQSLSLMKPRCEYSKISKPKCCYGISGIPMYKANGSKILNGVTPSADFYKQGSETFQQSDEETDSLGSHPKGLMSDSDSTSDKGVERDIDKKKVIMQNVNQRHLVNFLKVHLSKKFGEMSEGHLPRTVQSSHHSIQHTLSVESNREIKQRSLPPSVGGDYCLNKCQEPSFYPEMLEDQDTNLPTKTFGGLPAKALESTEDFKSKGTTSHSLINPHSSSTTKVISEVSTESGTFTLLKGSSESLHGDQVKTKNVAPVLNLLSTISLMNKVGEVIQHRLSEDFQTILGGQPPPLPVTNTIPDKTNQNPSLTGNIQPSKLPARQANRESAPKNKSVNFTDRTEMPEATNRDEAEPASMTTEPREIARAEELYALLSVTTSQQGTSQKKNRDTTATTENPPSKLSDPAPNISELRKQLIGELNLKLESRKQSQAQGQPKDMSSDSGSLTDKTSLTPAKCVSGVNKEVHQVLHVHSEDSTVRIEKPQESRLPRHALKSCQDENFPPGVKKDTVCPPTKPTASKYEELGGGDARVIISQLKGKRFPPQDTDVKDMHGSKSFHNLPQKGQAPTDGLFLNKMKNVFQRLHPLITGTMPETIPKAGRHISSAQSRGPVKNRATFTGTQKVHRVRSDIVNCPEEKQGHRQAGATTYPQEPLPSAMQSGKPVQKAAVQARVKSVQGCDLNCRALFPHVTNKKSGLQAAISDDQRSTSIRHNRKDERTFSKAVILKDHQVCQKHPQSVSLKGTVPPPSPTCRSQAAKGPPAVSTTAGGTAFRHQPPRFRHTMLLYNFQGKTFPAPK